MVEARLILPTSQASPAATPPSLPLESHALVDTAAVLSPSLAQSLARDLPGLTIEQPCLSLSDGSQLTGLVPVRVLPGRRWVMRGTWQVDGAAEPVYAKLFVGAQAQKYADRDAQGARWLMQAGLLTPALRWQGQAAQQAVQVLIYTAIPASETADKRYQALQGHARQALLQSLVETLAKQHAAGLVQTDLHLKNFLLAAQQVWSLDGDGIQRQRLSPRAAYRQLAELLSKCTVLDQHAWSADLLDTYQQARGWPQTFSAAKLLQWAKRLKAQEVNHYITRKLFRSCSDVQWQQDCRAAQACSVAGGLHLTDLPALEVAMHVGQVLKSGNTCTVVKTQLQDKPVVIKRYNIKHALHALSRAWRPSRAAASWQNAHRLLYYGIATPQPYLLFEQRHWGLRGRAYFVAAHSPWPDMATFFTATTDPALRARAIHALVCLCHQWALLGIVHGDLKASNLQVTDQGHIVVLDLDSMRQYRQPQRALRAHARDLRRLLQNWQAGSSLYNALVACFYQQYEDPAPLLLAGLAAQPL